MLVQVADIFLRVRIPLRRSLVVPVQRLHVILLHSQSQLSHVAELILRVRASVLGGALVPLAGLFIISRA